MRQVIVYYKQQLPNEQEQERMSKVGGFMIHHMNVGSCTYDFFNSLKPKVCSLRFNTMSYEPLDSMSVLFDSEDVLTAHSEYCVKDGLPGLSTSKLNFPEMCVKLLSTDFAIYDTGADTVAMYRNGAWGTVKLEDFVSQSIGKYLK